MTNLRWKELFKALFLAGLVAYLSVWVCDIVWVGVPVLVVFVWLFYDLRQKARIFKRILRRKFWQEIGESNQAKLQKAWNIAVEMKKFFWDGNRARITTIIGPAIICTMLFPLRDKEGAPLLVFLYVLLVIWAFVVFCVAQAGHLSGISDKKIALFLLRLIPEIIFWRIPKLILWLVPMFLLILLKIMILTVRAIHSKELVAVTFYSLGGMIYIIAFPPFGLAPTAIFLLAVGCGFFTGVLGMAVHKVLLTALVQNIFIKAEAW